MKNIKDIVLEDVRPLYENNEVYYKPRIQQTLKDNLMITIIAGR